MVSQAKSPRVRCGSGSRARSGSRAGFQRGGFTLIELLVSIAIIAILIGILIPSLEGARESGRRVRCLANLRGLGTGLNLYMDTNGRVLPKVSFLQDQADDEEGGEDDETLLDVLDSFIDAPRPRREIPGDETSLFVSTEPYVCPGDRKSSDAESGYEPVWRVFGTSYSYVPGLFIYFLEGLTVPRPEFGVTKAYENRRDWPVMADASWDSGEEAWHKGRSEGLPGACALFFSDGRADWAPRQASDAEMALFMKEAARFGGLALP